MRLLPLLRALTRRPSRAALLEIHIPISPNRHFFTMLHYFAASLRLNGGSLAGSRIVVSVGEDCEPYDLYRDNPWSRLYNLEWCWVDREQFCRQSYFATGNARFRYDYRAPAVMIADADVLVTADFADAVHDCIRAQAIEGVIAHVPPFKTKLHGPIKETWIRVFRSAGLPDPQFMYEHGGFGTLVTREDERYCPPYFNFGMLLGPASVMRQIAEWVDAEVAAVERVHDTHFKCQIALSLSVARLGIPVRQLPLRYNMPNDDRLFKRHPAEARQVRIFHYLSKHGGHFEKRRDFADYAAVAGFLNRDGLDDVNREMQRRLRPIHAQVLRDLAAAAAD